MTMMMVVVTMKAEQTHSSTRPRQVNNQGRRVE
jgi:hypothetical protein